MVISVAIESAREGKPQAVLMHDKAQPTVPKFLARVTRLELEPPAFAGNCRLDCGGNAPSL